jgi:hypothetical protein
MCVCPPTNYLYVCPLVFRDVKFWKL